MDFTGLRSRCWQGWFPSRGSRGEVISLLFPGSGGYPHPLADGPPLKVLKAIKLHLSDPSSYFPLTAAGKDSLFFQRTHVIVLGPPE